ncbi:MAG: PEGA domain-containing protein [Myxococcota bacterium]|nr:PEGA domain-containing protein [Myxococcota bacterium]
MPARTRSRLAWLALALAAASPAAAQDDPAADEEADPPLRVAVLLVPAGDVDPTAAEGLEELLIGAVAARGGLRIVGREELQAQLGQGDAAALECVASMTCLGRVGVQLGVREVIAGTLAQRGDEWVFHLDRVDVRNGETLGRVFREVRGDLGAVADALGAATAELYVPPVRPGALVVSGAPRGAEVTLDGVLLGHLGAEPLRRGDLEPGAHELRVEAPGHEPWSRTVEVTAGAELHLEPRLTEIAAPRARVEESIHPAVWVLGGVAAGSLAAAVALGVSSQTGFDPLEAEARQGGAVTRAEALEFYAAREREAIAADVLFAVAGAAAIAGVVALFFPERRIVLDEVGLELSPAGLRGTF